MSTPVSLTEKIKLCFSWIICGLLSTFGLTSSEKSNYFDASAVSKQSAITELRFIRESGHRESERVVELWNDSISLHASTLGHEKWAILEQVFIASLDISDVRLAHECLNELRAKFKDSLRVNRLSGMYLEKMNRFDDARALYSQLISDDPTNTFARKRMIAILKAQRKNVEAIEGLIEYLKIFMGDFEAWSELADLYLSECDYKHAAFCMEELLLSNPHHHLYCQRYAEIKYTEGGTDNLEIARAYFAQACHLSEMNLRSLFGLLLTCSALDSNLGKAFESAPTGTAASPIEDPREHYPQHQQQQPRRPTLPVSTSKGSSFSSFPVSPSCPACAGLLFNSSPSDGCLTVTATRDNASDQSSMSSSERNRRLAVWAKKQIDKFYQTACGATSSNPVLPLDTCKSELPNNVSNSPSIEDICAGSSQPPLAKPAYPVEADGDSDQELINRRPL